MLLMADTHGKTSFGVTLRDYDLLLHAGDLTDRGTLKELDDVAHWLSDIGARHTIAIAGNHDLCFQDERRSRALAILRRWGITYLEDSDVEVFGLKVYGTPWSPEFGDWAFMESEEELARRYAAIPDDVDILLTHGPPRGLGDMTSRGEAVGSQSLLDALFRVQPSLVVNGHIHEAHGVREPLWGGVIVNAACGLYWEGIEARRGAPVFAWGVGSEELGEEAPR